MVNRHKNWEHEYSFINAALSDSFVLFYYIICMWICQKLTWRILLSLTLHLCGNIGTMEGGTRTPSIRWITPLDAIISLVSRETPFSPNRILPCKRQTEVMGKHIHSQTFQSFSQTFRAYCNDEVSLTYISGDVDADDLLGHGMNLRHTCQLVYCKL